MITPCKAVKKRDQCISKKKVQMQRSEKKLAGKKVEMNSSVILKKNICIPALLLSTDSKNCFS